MAHRCDKCRTEYETGTFYGGHDYCMTCYVKMQQDDERKRRDEARSHEKREAERRELLRRRWEDEEMKKRAAYVRSPPWKAGTAESGRRESELKRQREIRDARTRESYAQQERKKEDDRKKAEEEMKRRRAWRISLGRMEKRVEKSGAQAGAGRGAETAQAAPGDAAWRILPSRMHLSERETSGGGYAVHGHEPDQARLSLEATAGLPVSLSVGQKNNSVEFVGKNRSVKKMDVEMVASLVDAKGKRVEMKIEPPGCGIEPDAEAKFGLKFDLKDDTPTGTLELNACIRENAIYMDREAGKSETLTLRAKVKTPLMLEYRKGSAGFSEKGGILLLCLTFDNLGESGGILSTKSGVSYGNGNPPARAGLAHKVKIKGLERNVKLEFAAEKQAPVEKLALELLGVDSNGKEYCLRKTVKSRS